MSDNLSWLDAEPEAIVEKLAEAAVYGRHSRALLKQAFDWNQIGSTLQGYGQAAVDKAKGAWDQGSTYVKKLPSEVQYGLAGAGLGAGVGGLTSMAQDPEDRQTAGSMLTGALAGGALGYGGSLAARQSGLLGGGNTAKAPGGTAGGAPAKPAVPLPPDVYEHNGQLVQPDQWAKDNPDKMRLLKDTYQPGGVQSGLESAGNFANNHKVLTGTVLANEGQLAARRLAEHMRPGGSLNVEQFKANLQKAVGEGHIGAPDVVTQGLATHSNAELQQALVNARQGLPTYGIPAEKIRDIQALGGGRQNPLSSVADISNHLRGKPNSGLYGTGYTTPQATPGSLATGTPATPATGLGGRLLRGLESRKLPTPPSGFVGKSLQFGKTHLGPPVAAGVASELTDYLWNLAHGTTNRQQLDALVKQHTTPYVPAK